MAYIGLSVMVGAGQSLTKKKGKEKETSDIQNMEFKLLK